MKSQNHYSRRYVRLGLVLSPLVLPAIALAGQLPQKFTLGRLLPEDVWFYVHAVHNPDREWIDREWADVFKAAKESGIDKDLADLMLSSVPEEKRKELEPKLERMLNVLRSVEWGQLIGTEFVFGERLSETKLTYDYIFLTSAAQGTGERHFKTLAAFIKEFSGTTSAVRVVESDENGVQRVAVHIAEKELKEFGVAMELFRRGDVIGFATGQSSAAAVVARLSQPGTVKSLCDTPRFAEALVQVESPTDSLIYVDAKRFFVDVRQMVKAVVALGRKGDDPKESGATTQRGGVDPLAALDSVLRLVDVAEYSITSTVTRDHMEYSDAVLMLQPGGQKTALVAACLDRRPFEKFDRFIPAEATGFSLSAGFDLQKIYQTIMDLLQEHAPQAVEAVASVHLELAQKGFDLERDLFSWWSGETISVDLPAAMVSPMGGSDGVLMIRVKDSAVASRKVNNAIDFLIEKLQAHGQPLMVSTSSVKADGFREVTHPALALFIRPVIGVHQDWLMIGSSAAALNKCLAVQAGEAPSIATREQFKREGLTPPGPVLSASFADQSKMGQEMAAGIGMVGMVGQMALMQVPDTDPEAKKFKQFAGSLLKIVSKLGPVLQKIDFYSSSSSYTTYDGEKVVRTKSVTTYKPTEKVATDQAKTK